MHAWLLLLLPLPLHARDRLQGFAVVCADLDAAIAVTDTLAPEHLEVQVNLGCESAKSRGESGIVRGASCC